jgi:hypothetical protein
VEIGAPSIMVSPPTQPNPPQKPKIFVVLSVQKSSCGGNNELRILGRSLSRASTQRVPVEEGLSRHGPEGMRASRDMGVGWRCLSV